MAQLTFLYIFAGFAILRTFSLLTVRRNRSKNSKYDKVLDHEGPCEDINARRVKNDCVCDVDQDPFVTLMSREDDGYKCLTSADVGCHHLPMMSNVIKKQYDRVLHPRMKGECLGIRGIDVWKLRNNSRNGMWMDVSSEMKERVSINQRSRLAVEKLDMRVWRGQVLKINFACPNECAILKVRGRIEYSESRFTSFSGYTNSLVIRAASKQLVSEGTVMAIVIPSVFLIVAIVVIAAFGCCKEPYKKYKFKKDMSRYYSDEDLIYGSDRSTHPPPPPLSPPRRLTKDRLALMVTEPGKKLSPAEENLTLPSPPSKLKKLGLRAGKEQHGLTSVLKYKQLDEEGCEVSEGGGEEKKSGKLQQINIFVPRSMKNDLTQNGGYVSR